MVSTRSQTRKALKTYYDHQSAARVGSIGDLLTEILLRLPVKSILRFKSVCKHWRLLLSHTRFIHRYDKLSKSPGLFLGDIYVPLESRSTAPYCSLKLCLKSWGAKIVQSCNGLICLKYITDYYVFNPTTKQLAIIPPVPGDSKVNNTMRLMALAFHPTDCVYYKVVCIRALEPARDLFQIQIYSSDTKKWKISIESFLAPKRISRNPVFWNGAVHWVSSRKDYMYLKIDDEQLQTMHLPEDLMSPNVHIMYFGESRGHLHLILFNIRRGQNILRLNVYELLRDHSGWFVKYQLELDELLIVFPEIIHKENLYNCYDFKVVDMVRGEAEEDTFVLLNSQEKIIKYNVHDKSFKQIYTLHSNIIPRYYSVGGIFEVYHPCFHRYTETLTSFK